jgi:hypothetical protein
VSVPLDDANEEHPQDRHAPPNDVALNDSPVWPGWASCQILNASMWDRSMLATQLNAGS